ncbi:MAG: hypothetical protein E2O39_06150 [Planctomycetota bacterium]|nr:MAG: hypothetical protein E2O39_06150 [Planctomycetota bacterium]
MSGYLRQGTLIALAAVFSWWICLSVPATLPLVLPFEPDSVLSVSIMPLVEAPDASEAPDMEVASAKPVEPAEPVPPEAAEAADEPVPAEPTAAAEELERELSEASEAAPPPPEAGDPDGEPEAESVEAPTEPDVGAAAPEDAPEDPLPEDGIEALMQDERLLESAERELAGEARLGFSTVLLAAPEDQIAIARTFGEELVLVPKSALDEGAERRGYFRLTPGDPPVVETVAGAPRLERYRQYRDLFDYEYARLPAPLRALRRSVLSRGEIYLFAALIPLREWALVVGRREAALAQTTYSAAEVRRYTLRYELAVAGGFDIRVQEILFTDGRRFAPSETH